MCAFSFILLRNKHKSKMPKAKKHHHKPVVNTAPKVYKCNSCDYSSNRLHNLATHEQSCSDFVVRYQCLVCSKSFSYFSSFKKHFPTHPRTLVTTVNVVATDGQDGKHLYSIPLRFFCFFIRPFP